jgi:hypothetical protein
MMVVKAVVTVVAAKGYNRERKRRENLLQKNQGGANFY